MPGAAVTTGRVDIYSSQPACELPSITPAKVVESREERALKVVPLPVRTALYSDLSKEHAACLP